MANNNNDSHWSLSLTLACLITDHLNTLTVNNLATLFCISLQQNYPRGNSWRNHANVLLSASSPAPCVQHLMKPTAHPLSKF